MTLNHIYIYLQGVVAATCHLSIADSGKYGLHESVLSDAKTIFGQFGIEHCTIQVEIIAVELSCRNSAGANL